MKPEIAFSKEQQDIFQEGLRLFVKQVDQCVDNGKTTLGIQKTSLKDQINQSLELINYVCHPNFGSGNLSGIPSISFYRNDLFSLLKINGKKPSLQYGVYIWFGYSYSEGLYYLKFAFPNGDINNSRCIAVNKMEQDGICNPNGKYWFEWKKSDDIFEEIASKFLELVKYFDRFPAKDFQDYEAKKELEEAFKKFENKLYPYNNQSSQELQYLASEKKIRVLPSLKTRNSALYLLKAPIRGIKALATNSDDPFDNHISCADFLRYCDNEKTTYAWAEPIFKLILQEEYEGTPNSLEQNNDDKILNNTIVPLNQIFYGSPGTGKTYDTITKALEIILQKDQSIDNFLKKEILDILINLKSDFPSLEKRKQAKEIFDNFKEVGQIEFVTFHQSYGYEEFVEGIKPTISENINNNENQQIKYEIKKGVFQRLCETAMKVSFTTRQMSQENGFSFNSSSTIWKMSLGEQGNEAEQLQNYCFQHNQIRIGWNDLSPDSEKSLRNFYNMSIGDIVCILKSSTSINAIGIVKSGVKEDNINKEDNIIRHFKRYREVEWLIQDQEMDFLKLNQDVKLARQTAYCLWRVQHQELFQLIQDKQLNKKVEFSILEDNTQKPYILIIDEINRGNISKIFGELITLIEPSKRIGADEELRVILPYSQKPFGVPSNLYIIGTMNTADRSITNIDTALRRRFEFVEMMPNPSRLKILEIEWEKEERKTEINLKEMLKAINERIEYLCGREKTIGHAYLIEVDSLQSLKNNFQNKIIPLLQEYFYNDYEAISAVLNDNGMIRNNQDFKYTQGSFRTFTDNRGMSEKKVFRIATETDKNKGSNKYIWEDTDTYIAIYDDEVSQKLKEAKS